MIFIVIDVSTRAISFTRFSRHSYNEISALSFSHLRLFAIFNVELTKPRRDTRFKRNQCRSPIRFRRSCFRPRRHRRIFARQSRQRTRVSTTRSRMNSMCRALDVCRASRHEIEFAKLCRVVEARNEFSPKKRSKVHFFFLDDLALNLPFASAKVRAKHSSLSL